MRVLRSSSLQGSAAALAAALLALVVPAVALADVPPIAAGSPFHRAIEIESDDAAHVLVAYPVDWSAGRPGRMRVVASPGRAVGLGRAWSRPRIWALTSEELATLPEMEGEELDAWMSAFAGPRSDEVATDDVGALRVAGVTDVYAAHVEGDRVVLRLLRSEYEHHSGNVEVVDALADGSRGLPTSSPIDDARVAVGFVPFCCYPLPCCGLILIAPFVWRAWKRRRASPAST